jgi:hypothetical protein
MWEIVERINIDKDKIAYLTWDKYNNKYTLHTVKDNPPRLVKMISWYSHLYYVITFKDVFRMYEKGQITYDMLSRGTGV